MKKIKSIYILFVFAALSSYGLWSCTNSGTSETTSDSTQVEEVEEPDTRPATAKTDDNFYIKVTLEGKEYNFNYLPLDGANKYNLIKDDLFRIERCADPQCKRNFYLQAHNFNLNQATPFTLIENVEGTVKKDIIINLVLTNNKGEFKGQLKDADSFEMTINKIDGDIYEGTFKGKVQELDAKVQKGALDITGSFRIKMIVRNPVA